MENIIPSLLDVPEIEISYRGNLRPSERPVILNSRAAYEIFMRVWDLDKIELVEQAYALFLSKNSSCLGISRISTGGKTSCILDPRIVFATALKANATSIILAHNHPSGNLQPSKKDNAITKKFVDGGEILDITVLDHIIVSGEGFCSMASEGFIPAPNPF